MKTLSQYHIIFLILFSLFAGACKSDIHEEHAHHGHDEHEEEAKEGPHGGKLFEEDGFAVEVTIYEPEIPPQSRVYVYFDEEALDPSEVTLVTELHRLDRIDTIQYSKQEDYLLGDVIVEEPHSFDVKLKANYKGKEYAWQYSSYEGRTTIPDDAMKRSGIETEKVGAANIATAVHLNGRVIPNGLTVANISARFPGLVRSIQKLPGNKVKKGDILATIESNESLQSYHLQSPLDGEVLSLHTAAGEAVEGAEPIFLVGDLSSVWIELSVPKSEFAKLKIDQKVRVTFEGKKSEEQIEGKLIYLSPVADPDSQTLLARAEIPNPARALVPELFVDAEIFVQEREVPLSVKKESLQTFRNWQVVFVKKGEVYEVAPLELGEEDGDWVEVRSGLRAGLEYVTKNSFVVKADVMKSGATHDH